MRETLKIAILVFAAILIPITLWSAGQFYFAHTCDPKFGCLGSFKLVTLIVIICAAISSFFISTAYFIFIERLKLKRSFREVLLILACCLAISIASGNALYLAESVGSLGIFIFIWATLSFLIGVAVFKLSRKI